MISNVTAVNLRQNPGKLLSEVQFYNDSVIIDEDGKPVPLLTDAGLSTRIRILNKRFDSLSDRIAESQSTGHEQEGLDEIYALIAAERKL